MDDDGPGLKNIVDFAPFVPISESVNRSTERARGALFILLLVSALLVALATEKAIAPWGEIRLGAYGVLADFLPATERYAQSEDEFVAFVIEERKRQRIVSRSKLEQEWAHKLNPLSPLPIQDYSPSAESVFTSKELRDLENSARVALRVQNENHFASPSDFEGRVKDLKDQKYRAMYIKLPLLDFNMDANNLTPLASFIGTFFMFVTMLALRREHQSLGYAYDVAHELFPVVPGLQNATADEEAKESKDNRRMRQLCRDLLTMSQLLQDPTRKVTRAEWVTRILLLAVPFSIFVHLWSDIDTIEIGTALNPYLTFSGLAFALGCSLVSCYLYFMIIQTQRMTKEFWDVWVDETQSKYIEARDKLRSDKKAAKKARKSEGAQSDVNDKCDTTNEKLPTHAVTSNASNEADSQSLNS